MKKSMILLVVLLLLLSGCAQDSDSGSTKKSSKQTVQEKSGQEKSKDKNAKDKKEEKADSKEKSKEKTKPQSVWTATEMPVHLDYARMWGYGAYGETDDPELIAEAVDALKAIRIKESTDMCVDDYSDYLTFTFEDGSEVSLSFEEQIWVVGEGERYRVDGLKQLRSILDPLIGEDY